MNMLLEFLLLVLLGVFFAYNSLTKRSSKFAFISFGILDVECPKLLHMKYYILFYATAAYANVL